MKKHRILIAFATGALALTACGSDGGSGAASGPQADAADRTIEQAAEDGVELEEGCVNEVTAKLSDDDAEAIAAGRDSDVSAEGQALAIELVQCADADALADLFIEGMSQGGQEFDEDCVRDKLSEFDIAEVVAASDSGSPPAELVTAMMGCMDLGE